MGGGYSIRWTTKEEPAVPGPLLDSPTSPSSKVRTQNRHPKKMQIYEKGASVGDIESVLNTEPMEKATEDLIVAALKDFFLFDNANGTLDMALRAMRREDFDSGDVLMSEGEPGSELYIIEAGEVLVTINGNEIRRMGRASLIGELALLYDAPRSATVVCVSPVIVWSLRREVFRRIQVAAVSAVEQERARQLISSPDLAVLTPIELSRLMSTFQVQVFEEGSSIFQLNQCCKDVYLILSGQATISTTIDTSGKCGHDIDNMLTIYRPRARTLSADFMQIMTAEKGDALRPAAAHSTVHSPNVSVVVSEHVVGEVYEGCIIGIGALRGSAQAHGCAVDGAWRWASNDGAISPITVTATSVVRACSFSVAVYERLFGPVGSGHIANAVRSGRRATGMSVRRCNFEITKFVVKRVLGSGNFGTVTLAEYTGDSHNAKQVYALKTLSKSAVVEMEQVQHVLDEKKLLARMNSPFIVKLFGTYQTAHRLVFVLEVVDRGDLWTVIYEVPEHAARRGLPHPLAVFYSTCLVLALGHIHEHGIAYRDLKPENIMVDSKGYIRIIDFGFAKTIPYTKQDENGKVTVQPKSFTLCGTPEYLAPEFVFNCGHDFSVDIWALGIVIYEMYLSCTPFAPKRPDNVTELFQNIANVKKNGINFPASLETIANGRAAESLISHLLKAEPEQRLGVREGMTKVILEHEYFRGISVDAVGLCSYSVPYVPDEPEPPDEEDELPSALRPYNGDQTIFEEFSQ